MSVVSSNNSALFFLHSGAKADVGQRHDGLWQKKRTDGRSMQWLWGEMAQIISTHILLTEASFRVLGKRILSEGWAQ